MKTLISNSLFTLLFLVALLPANAQDKMILRAKADTLRIKVMEVGTDEVKYKLWPVSESMPVMVERKDRIRRIIFENGIVMKFAADEFSDPTNYADQRKTAIKLDPFGIIKGITSIAFEQSMKPGRSWEVGMGLIGLGSTADGERYSGLLIRAGYKFINQPDYYLKGMRYTHILKGAYIRPEIVGSFYNSTITNQYYNYNNSTSFTHDDKYQTSAFAFMLNFGKQYVFDDIFVVDAFAGLGIGGGSKTAVDVGHDIGSSSYGTWDLDLGLGMNANNFGFLTSTKGSMALAGQLGLKVGILIGSKKTEKN